MTYQRLVGPKVMPTYDWTSGPVLCHLTLGPTLQCPLPLLAVAGCWALIISRNNQSPDLLLYLANRGHWQSTQRQAGDIVFLYLHLQKGLHLLQGASPLRVWWDHLLPGPFSPKSGSSPLLLLTSALPHQPLLASISTISKRSIESELQFFQ